jgi:hypothetical protein
MLQICGLQEFAYRFVTDVVSQGPQEFAGRIRRPAAVERVSQENMNPMPSRQLDNCFGRPQRHGRHGFSPDKGNERRQAITAHGGSIGER